MKSQKPKQSQQSQRIGNEDKELIGSFLEFQRIRVENESKKIQLQQRQLDANAKLANKSLDIQREVLLKEGEEKRKTINTFTISIIGMGVLLFGFIFACLYIGATEFVMVFIQIVGYIIVAYIGYYFGQKRVANNDHSEIQDVEIIDD